MKIRLGLISALVGAATMMLATGQDQTKKEITVWSWFISSTMEKSIKAFEEKNPGLKVRYTYYNYSPQYITALKSSGGFQQPAGYHRTATRLTDPAISRAACSPKLLCGQRMGRGLEIKNLPGQFEADGDGKSAQ